MRARRYNRRHTQNSRYAIFNCIAVLWKSRARNDCAEKLTWGIIRLYDVRFSRIDGYSKHHQPYDKNDLMSLVALWLLLELIGF